MPKVGQGATLLLGVVLGVFLTSVLTWTTQPVWTTRVASVVDRPLATHTTPNRSLSLEKLKRFAQYAVNGTEKDTFVTGNGSEQPPENGATVVEKGFVRNSTLFAEKHGEDDNNERRPVGHLAEIPVRMFEEARGKSQEVPQSKSWVVVVTPEVNKFTDRVANVKAMLQVAPFIQVFNASLGADTGCRAFLREHEIRVSPSYWQGGGSLSAGKVGHWCSFLRFAHECSLRREGTRVCVWIEDDVVLGKADATRLLALADTAKFTTPILRAGVCCDRINLFDSSQVHKLLNHVRERGIENPTDLVFDKYRLASTVAHIGKMLDSGNKGSTSLIRTMPMLDIARFNREVHGS